MALDCLAQVRGGVDPLTPTQDDLRFAALAEAYKKAHRHLHSEPWRLEVERVLEVDIGPHINRHRCGAIKRQDIARIVEKVAERQRYQAANLALKVVRGVFRWGVASGRCDTDPTMGLNRFPCKPRGRLLNDDEIRLVWTTKSEFQDAYRLQLVLGLRIGEVLNSVPVEVDVAERLWVLPACRTKSRREHKVPLTDLAIDVLQKRLGYARWLFPSEGGDVPLRTRSAAHSLRKLVSRASISPSFTPHDLRRTVATRMGELGVADDVVERILNHSGGMTRRHYNLARRLQEMRDALDLWANELVRLV